MQIILPFIPVNSTKINDILTLVRDGEECFYHLGIWPVYKHKVNDDKHFRLISAQLIESGTCRQCEIVKVFAVSRKKLNRAVKQLKERGIASFFSKRSGRRGGTVLTPDKLQQAQQLLDHGDSRCEVSSELRAHAEIKSHFTKRISSTCEFFSQSLESRYSFLDSHYTRQRYFQPLAKLCNSTSPECHSRSKRLYASVCLIL